MISADEDELREAFKVAIKSEVTDTIRRATVLSEVKDLISSAFMKKWSDNRDNWIEKTCKQALHQAMWQSVSDIIEESGVKDMMRQCVKDHIETPEFKEALMRRTIETLMETTFYVKPQKEEDMEDMS